MKIIELHIIVKDESELEEIAEDIKDYILDNDEDCPLVDVTWEIKEVKDKD